MATLAACFLACSSADRVVSPTGLEPSEDLGSAADGGASSSSPPSTPGDSGVDAAAFGDEWLTGYFAGTTATGPGGLNGPTGLESAARQLAIFSNGDFAVAGDEEYNAGGRAGVRWTDAVYVFKGTDGDLLWKETGHYLTTGAFVAGERKLAGIDAADALYLAGRWQLAKVTKSKSLVWATPKVDSAHPLHAMFTSLGGVAAQTPCVGGVVTPNGDGVLIGQVSGDLAHHGQYYGVAQQITATGTLGWRASVSQVQPYTTPLEVGGAFATFAADLRTATPQGGMQIAIWKLDGATGASEILAVSPPAGLVTTSATGYVRNWVPIAAAVLSDGSYAVAAQTSFYDNASLPNWLWHVSATGQLLSSEELAPLEHVSGVAATPEGFVALGVKGNTVGPSLARRYSAELVVLGEHDLTTALSNKPAELTAAATRGGATVFAGLFRPAMPQSAAKVMLLGRTHFPPAP